MILEVTALPTESQPLPKVSKVNQVHNHDQSFMYLKQNMLNLLKDGHLLTRSKEDEPSYD